VIMTRGRASLSWSAVTARRMARHHLAAPAADRGLAGVTSDIGAVHAQVPSAAELSLGRRVAGATRADVQAALWDERTLVRTFGPRGTVHLLASTDLPMWTGALGALPSSVPQHPDPVRFTAEQADEVIAAIGDALATDDLTVDELTDAIRQRTGEWAVEATMDAFAVKWPRWRQLTSTAAHRGVLCFGPNRGRNVTYADPRRWLPGFRPAPAHEAVGALLRRYLLAFGPASPAHFARWLNLPPRQASEIFADAADAIEPVDLDGQEAWVVAGDAEVPSEPHRGITLLPYFDAYAVGGQPREWLYPGPAAARGLGGGQAGNFPVFLVDGIVGGVWHQRRTGSKLAITVEPLGQLTGPQRRQLDDEVELMGRVMEATPTLKIGKVTVGPHA
jgi:hypothetical protein